LQLLILGCFELSLRNIKLTYYQSMKLTPKSWWNHNLLSSCFSNLLLTSSSNFQTYIRLIFKTLYYFTLKLWWLDLFLLFFHSFSYSISNSTCKKKIKNK
jgi:hypothetical protein